MDCNWYFQSKGEVNFVLSPLCSLLFSVAIIHCCFVIFDLMQKFISGFIMDANINCHFIATWYTNKAAIRLGLRGCRHCWRAEWIWQREGTAVRVAQRDINVLELEVVTVPGQEFLDVESQLREGWPFFGRLFPAVTHDAVTTSKKGPGECRYQGLKGLLL